MGKYEILKIENLSKKYFSGGNLFRKRGEVTALSDVSLSVMEKEILGIAGESGCGKTTLGNITAGLIPQDSGRIFFKGKDISDFKKRKKEGINHDIRMIFQDSHGSFNPKKKMGWIMEEIFTVRRMNDREKNREEILGILEKVGLNPTLLKKYPSELSGGEAQRFNTALAVMLSPSLVIADEAVSSLDVSVQSQVLNLMNDLREKLNLTYVFISHNLSVVNAMSDKMAVMYLGSVVEYGLPEEITGNPMHPYTKLLVSSVPGFKKKDKLPYKNRKEDYFILMAGGCPYRNRCPYEMKICGEVKPHLKISDTSGRLTACHLYGEE